jgi:hypothetical protein
MCSKMICDCLFSTSNDLVVCICADFHSLDLLSKCTCDDRFNTCTHTHTHTHTHACTHAHAHLCCSPIINLPAGRLNCCSPWGLWTRRANCHTPWAPPCRNCLWTPCMPKSCWRLRAWAAASRLCRCRRESNCVCARMCANARDP